MGKSITTKNLQKNKIEAPNGNTIRKSTRKVAPSTPAIGKPSRKKINDLKNSAAGKTLKPKNLKSKTPNKNSDPTSK
jgi:hypothetical protein